MQQSYSTSFKLQAVKKALNRPEGVSVTAIASSLDISKSALHSWLKKARSQSLESTHCTESADMTTEKRPQDFTLEERLEIIIACGALDDQGIGELCRKQGLYPHHITQWKRDFIDQQAGSKNAENRSDIKALKAKNLSLSKELTRKEKALAETAALLVLQKKFAILMGEHEENSR